MRFEWNEEKAARNLSVHDVSFDEAKTVFADPLFLIALDPEHSVDERRYVIRASRTQNDYWLLHTPSESTRPA